MKPINIIYSFLVFIINNDILIRIFNFRGIYIISLSFLIICLAYIARHKQFKKIVYSFTPFTWLLLVIYMFFNWLFAGLQYYDNVFYFVVSHFCLPIGTMWMVYYASCIDHNRTLKIILYSFVIYTILGMLLQKSGSGDGIGWDSRGGAELGNGLALHCVCMCFFACISNITNCISKKISYMILILVLAGIMFVATRKALIGVFIIIFFYSFTIINFKKSTSIVKLLVFTMGLVLVGYYVLNFTQLGMRMAVVEQQSEMVMMRNSNIPTYLKFLGDRAIQYLLAWDLFVEHPITGVGLKNFIVLTNYPVVLHTEYMVQLSENGIIGFILFSTFIGSMLYHILRTYKAGFKNIALVCMGGLFAILFIDLTAWTYEFPRYFTVYGTILAYCCPIGQRRINFFTK